jgi:CheY-like chemotaxis protein
LTIHIAYVENDSQHQLAFKLIATSLKIKGIDNILQIYDTHQTAINQLPSERPDVVFVNLRMRNGRHTAGVDIVRALGQHPLCQASVIIGMAEQAMPADRSAALAAGCRDFVSLPIHFQDIENVILQQRVNLMS